MAVAGGWTNVFIERLWRSLKHEDIAPWADRVQLIEAKYVVRWNFQQSARFLLPRPC